MQRKSRLGLIGAASAAVALSVAAVAPVSARPNPDLASHVHFMPVKGATAAVIGQAKGGGGGKPGGGGGSTGTQAGIYYHGGRVAASTFHVVSIYWSSGATYPGGPNPNGGELTGTGSQDGSLVGAFLRGLGGSPYYNINKGYWDNHGTSGALRYVTGDVSYDGYWADGTNAPSGSQNVSDGAVTSEIVAGFTSGKLTYHPDTVYAVFSAADVNLGGGAFSQYCAYHGYFDWNGNDVLYAVMPYNDHSGCRAQTTGPNGDPADFEVNTLAHEIEEANTDPDLSAWWDRRGYENADKCAWTFGTVYTAANGAYANMSFGGHDWLVQQNWRNSGRGSCGLS